MRLALSLMLFAALQIAPAFAQQNPIPPCAGDYVTVRVSRILPGGSMKGFLAAVAAHKAWYRANGFKDNEIVASRVILHEDATGKYSYSDKEVITYHFRPPSNVKNRDDDAWKAYVKQYRDNSEIVSEYFSCMPKMSK